MKKTNILSLLLVLFCFALVTGCTPNTDTPDVPEETTYTVTYSSEYGRAPASITVTENTVLTAEQLPDLSTEGKTFDGWFDGDTKAEAGKYKVTKTVILTAKWDENTPEPAPEDDSNNDDENQEGSEETTPTETESEDPPVVDEPEEHPENTETDDNPTTETDNGESEESEDNNENLEGVDEENEQGSEDIILTGTLVELIKFIDGGTTTEWNTDIKNELVRDSSLFEKDDSDRIRTCKSISKEDMFNAIRYYGRISNTTYNTFKGSSEGLEWYYELSIKDSEVSETISLVYK